ncbi:MAG TPA: glycosyl hydrolase [Actinoplanes sp.]|nr:glycosyl hydrolase [Actinoplanes sp.]
MSTGHHRAPGGMSRRGVLGLAGLGLGVAGGGFGILQAAGPSGRITPVQTAASSAPTPAPFADVDDPGELGGTVPFRENKVIVGSYLGLDGLTYPEAVKLRRKQLGRDQAITHVFYAWGDRLPSSIEGMPKKSIPMVSWRGTKYARILNGSDDEMIAGAARRIKRFDRPVLLRWGWQMNDRGYEWGGAQNGKDSEGYVKAFRRLRKIFDKQGADQVSWVWSPNWSPSTKESWDTFEAYYPGDEYVDWVGVSGYNVNKETPATLFDPIYHTFAARKPLMLTEVGSKDWGGTTKAEWIGELDSYIGQRPAIGGMVWFDTDTDPSYPEHWRIDTHADATAAYRKMVTSARFSS